MTLFLNVMNDGWSSFSFLHTHLFQENSFIPNCRSFAHLAEMEVTEIILAKVPCIVWRLFCWKSGRLVHLQVVLPRMMGN